MSEERDLEAAVEAIIDDMKAAHPPAYWSGARDECSIILHRIEEGSLSVGEIVLFLRGRLKWL